MQEHARAIRITAVPRSGYPNSGLLATCFAKEFSDEVWVIPGSGEPLPLELSPHFSVFDRKLLKKLFGVKLVRYLSLLSVFLRSGFSARDGFIVHSFLFALPLFVLRKRYCIFIHGSDRRFLTSRLGRAIARRAKRVYGIGFGGEISGIHVREIPNLFRTKTQNLSSLGSFDVIFILRNAPVKNPSYPIALAEALGASVTIGILGMTEEETGVADRARLLRARAGGAEISYLGRCDYEEVLGTMATSRIVMIPSHSEGIPKVLLEASSLGAKVVVNSKLSFADDLEPLYTKCDLSDWPAIKRLIELERGGSPDERSRRAAIANAYLERSRAALCDLHREIYPLILDGVDLRVS